MAKHEWKPGDVAEVTWDNATGDQAARGLSRIETKRGFVVKHDRGLWFVFDVTSRIATDSHYIKQAVHLPVIELPNGAKAGWPVLIDALERAKEKTGLDMVFGGLIEQIQVQTEEPSRWTPGDVVMVWNDHERTTDPITLTRRSEGWLSDRSAGSPWLDTDVEDVLASRGTQHFRVGLVLREQKAGVNP